MENVTGPAHAAGGALHEVGGKSVALGKELNTTRDRIVGVFAKLGPIAEQLEAIKAEIEQAADESSAPAVAGEAVAAAEQASEALTPLAMTTDRLNDAMLGTVGVADLTVGTGVGVGGSLNLAKEQGALLSEVIAKIKEVEANAGKTVSASFNTAATNATAQSMEASNVKSLIDTYLAGLGLPTSPEESTGS